MPRLLLAHNPTYWPSVGGSERILQRILEGVRDDFERVVVFAGEARQPFEHNGIEVRPYGAWDLRRFGLRERPDVYFPNMIHNRITYLHLAWLSRVSRRTVLNVIGGYRPADSFLRRMIAVSRAARHVDAMVHVDPLSTEWLIDRALRADLPVVFIPQGLDLEELASVRADSSDGYLLYAHNLWHWKRPDVFLTEIAARAPELRFKLIASDSTGDVIAETVALAAEIPNVEVQLGLPREAYLSTLARAAAVVSTSSAEGAQPNIMLEAGALDVPYLSLCPGQNFAHYGHVEMYADVDALLARIRSGGPALRDELLEAIAGGRPRFDRESFAWSRIIPQFRALFLDSLEPHLVRDR
jgi:glycosyltransferase involved in cell wall biosynthesis